MERPSHSIFQTSQPLSRRLGSLGLAISLPFAILWALAHGMGARIVDHFGPLVYVREKDPVKPRTPPPLPLKLETITQPKAIPPQVHFDQEQKNDRGLIAVTPPIPKTEAVAAAGPDRAVASVASTHTIPPYPLLALRMGAEGKVTLRLTVLPDGKVGAADIVTSSGRADMDQAARDWIVAHWLYKPALDKGQAIASQAQATVIFSLNNQH